MIAGATRGAGGRALGKHLADTKRQNEVTRPGASRGLVSEDTLGQIAELTDLASHARSVRPLYHTHADPAGRWTEEQWDAHWERTEREFGLERQPFAEAIHVKGGREHRHRVYSLVKPDGTCIRMDHDHARREKLSRIAELMTGEKLTPGAHNRAVIHALDREGQGDFAAELRAAGLDVVERPRAGQTPQERAQAERSGVSKDSIREAALAAWREADGGQAFEVALAARGLRLAQGDSTPQIVDLTGGTHDLRRTLAAAAKENGGEKVTAAAVRGRLAGLALPGVDEARRAVAEVPARPASETPVTAPKFIPFYVTNFPEVAEVPESVSARAAPKEGNRHVEHAAEASSDRPKAEAEALDGHGRRRPDRGDHGGRQDPVSPADGRQPRHDARDLRRPADSAADRLPDRSPRPAGAPGGEGADAARPDPRAPRAHRREPDPDRAAAGRARVAARRQTRSLAAATASRTDRFAALTAALAPPADRLRAALRDSDQRVRQVLAGAPWSDPATRDAARISGRLHDDAMEAQRDREYRAEAARKALQEARGRVGVLDRLAARFGVRTTALRDVDEAETRALRADGDRDHGGYALRDEGRRADREADRIVRGREEDRQAWDRRSDVQAARQEAHGNGLVRAALAAGDPQVAALAKQDLAAARDLVLRREAAERLRLEAKVSEQIRQLQDQARRPQSSAPARAQERRLQ